MDFEDTLSDETLSDDALADDGELPVPSAAEAGRGVWEAHVDVRRLLAQATPEAAAAAGGDPGSGRADAPARADPGGSPPAAPAAAGTEPEVVRKPLVGPWSGVVSDAWTRTSRVPATSAPGPSWLAADGLPPELQGVPNLVDAVGASSADAGTPSWPQMTAAVRLAATRVDRPAAAPPVPPTLAGAEQWHAEEWTSRKVFIGGLPMGTEPSAIVTAFHRCGEVIHTEVSRVSLSHSPFCASLFCLSL